MKFWPSAAKSRIPRLGDDAVFSQALLEDDAFGKVDCLISDIGMPTIDGFDLERLARAARPELSVILVTGRLELIKGRMTPPRT